MTGLSIHHVATLKHGKWGIRIYHYIIQYNCIRCQNFRSRCCYGEMENRNHLLKKFYDLSWPERALFFEAALWLTLASGIRRFVPLRLWLKRIGVIGAEAPAFSGDEMAVRRVEAAINRASRLAPVFENCLLRSLAVLLMLRRHRIRATLCIGVAEGTDQSPFSIDAHAWVRCGHIKIGSQGRMTQILQVASY